MASLLTTFSKANLFFSRGWLACRVVPWHTCISTDKICKIILSLLYFRNDKSTLPHFSMHVCEWANLPIDVLYVTANVWCMAYGISHIFCAHVQMSEMISYNLYITVIHKFQIVLWSSRYYKLMHVYSENKYKWYILTCDTRQIFKGHLFVTWAGLYQL